MSQMQLRLNNKPIKDMSKAERRAYNRERQRAARKKKRGRERMLLPVGRSAVPGTMVPLDIEAGIDWIEKTLVVPPGHQRSGQLMQLMDWQKDWLRRAYAPGIKEAGLSCGRKNAKSTTIAATLACHLAGPWKREGWMGLVASTEADKAKSLRQLVTDLSESSGLSDVIQPRVSPTPGLLLGTHGRVQFLAADKNAGQAHGADLAIIDEYGLLRENQRNMVNQMFSSMGSREESRLFGISFQSVGEMFRELEQRAGDSNVVWRRWQADESLAIDDPAAWEQANPGLGHIKSRSHMEAAARRAVLSPHDLRDFRAQELNQDVDAQAQPVVDPSAWRALYDESADLRNEPVVVGIDMGGSVSMCAVVAIGIETGTVWARAAFPSDVSLLARGLTDGVGNRYEIMADHYGELRTYPGSVVPIGLFLRDCLDELAGRGCHVEVITGDKWEQARVIEACQSSGYNGGLELRRTGRGPSGFDAVRALQRMILQGKLRVKPGLLIENALGNSVIEHDNNRNPYVEKAKSRARIDALVALMAACGMVEAEAERENKVQHFT